MNDKLIPCPVCGKIPFQTHGLSEYDRNPIRVRCVNNECWLAIIMLSQNYLYWPIIEDWNHRVYPLEVQAVIDAAKKVTYALNTDLPFHEANLISILDTAIKMLDKAQP
jgi:hypothetical protein